MNIDIKNISLVSGDFISSDCWTDIILEYNGSFGKKQQHIIFDCENNEIYICFDYYVDAHISKEDGDYYLPSSTEIIINNVEIDIRLININSIETKVDDITHSFIIKQIKKELKL